MHVLARTDSRTIDRGRLKTPTAQGGRHLGVDLGRDNLAAYPFLYWAAPSSPQRLSDAALANLDHYLAIGGLLLVDTRDAGRTANAGARPAQLMLAGVDVPPLALVNSDHVVARAFYLMRSFPGRYASPRLWAETASAASAWAGEGGIDDRQREMSLRFGVNMVMVALTGNYKSDQVHVQTLLERLGEQSR